MNIKWKPGCRQALVPHTMLLLPLSVANYKYFLIISGMNFLHLKMMKMKKACVMIVQLVQKSVLFCNLAARCNLATGCYLATRCQIWI